MSFSYVPSDVQTWANNQFNNLQATFGRPVTIYREAQQTVVMTNPDNNYLFQAAPFNSIVNTVVQSGIAIACVVYGKRENLSPFNTVQRNNSAEQNQIRLEEGEARLTLDPTGIALVEGCQRVQLDGTIFDVVTSKRPRGMFGEPNFADFYLKKIN